MFQQDTVSGGTLYALKDKINAGNLPAFILSSQHADLLTDIFNDSGNTLSAAHTGRHDTVFFMQSFHVVGKLNG